MAHQRSLLAPQSRNKSFKMAFEMSYQKGFERGSRSEEVSNGKLEMYGLAKKGGQEGAAWCGSDVTETGEKVVWWTGREWQSTGLGKWARCVNHTNRPPTANRSAVLSAEDRPDVTINHPKTNVPKNEKKHAMIACMWQTFLSSNNLWSALQRWSDILIQLLGTYWNWYRML